MWASKFVHVRGDAAALFWGVLPMGMVEWRYPQTFSITRLVEVIARIGLMLALLICTEM